MKKTRTRILGGASIAGFAVAATLALPPAAHAEPTGFGSSHSGGVNVLFGDGSVRSISYSTNQTVWTAMGSRAGGQVVGDLLMASMPDGSVRFPQALSASTWMSADTPNDGLELGSDW
jgi:prepilin-type processing-associated H-X9-DG protein